MLFSPKLVHLFFLFIQKVQKQVRKQDTPLSIPEFIALKLIKQNEPTTLTELSELLGVKKASTSEVVSKFEMQKLIIKNNDKMDKRQHHISVSAKGRSIMRQMFTTSSKFMGGLFDILSKEEQKQLKYLLTKLIKYDGKN